MIHASGNCVLAYRSGTVSGNTQLTWFDRAGKQLGLVGSLGEYLNPELSPDGRRVAVQRRSAQGDWDIWLLELLGGTSTRFTFNPADDYYPIWSPDGSRIVFASTRDGSYGLYQKPSSGAGNEEPLLKSSSDIGPFSWSSDGRFIAYRIAETNNEVWVLPLFGDRKPFPLLQAEFNETQPDLSPDERWVAYASTESGRFEVYIQSFPKPGGKWQVSTGGGVNPPWSRDAKEIFWIGADGKMMVVPIKANPNLEVGIPKALFATRQVGGGRIILNFRHQYDV